ncbi:cytochrom P450 [Trametopsis cervina]|nr:cytochrom P450 [Trametopsis cervina]
MSVPPGIAFLLSNLPSLLAPPVSVYLACRVIGHSLGVDVPTWAEVAAAILSWPAVVFVGTYWSRWRIQQKAAAAGAAVPARVRSKWPGGLDLVFQFEEDRRNRFLAYRFMELVSEYGYTCNASVLLQDRIFTTEPEYIKRILATDFANHEKGAVAFEQLRSLLGTGVFNSDGEMWKFHRGISRPYFSKDRIAHFEVFDRHASAAIDLIKGRMQEGHAIDFQDLVARFTLDSATEFLFGKDLCSLSAGLPYASTSGRTDAHSAKDHPANKFANSFWEAQELTAKRAMFMKAWPLWEFWTNTVDKHTATMDAFIEPLLKEAIAKKGQAKNTSGDEEDETLLQNLVKSTDDPKVIRDETLNILLAGRDTTALTLTMAVYSLSQHPDILRRLREEILGSVGNGRPTYEDIKQLKYLRAFINEVLRLYPAVPFNTRHSVNDAVLPAITPGGQPLFVQGGTRMLYSVFIMHRRKDLWGPDALEFDPDRFLDERAAKYLTPNPFIFLPFNAGPRICLGQQFAYNEISFMLIRLLQQVTDIDLVQEVHPEAVPAPGRSESKFSNGKERVIIRSHLTMYVEGGLWVKMKVADV